MKIYLRDQKNKLEQHLDDLKTKRVMGYDKARLRLTTTSIEVETTQKIEQLNLDFLLAYQIFPNNIMIAQNQWTTEGRAMKIGDTIAQQIFLPPITNFSQKIIFGVRINEIINEVDRKGFSYETLEGHVEKGVATFTIEQQEGKIIFKIQTYAVPANLLTALLGPIFSIPYQTFCTKQALKNVKRQLEHQ